MILRQGTLPEMGILCGNHQRAPLIPGEGAQVLFAKRQNARRWKRSAAGAFSHFQARPTGNLQKYGPAAPDISASLRNEGCKGDHPVRIPVRDAPPVPGDDGPRGRKTDTTAAACGAGGVRPAKAVKVPGQPGRIQPGTGLDMETQRFRPLCNRENRMVPPVGILQAPDPPTGWPEVLARGRHP